MLIKLEIQKKCVDMGGHVSLLLSQPSLLLKFVVKLSLFFLKAVGRNICANICEKGL